MQFDAVILYYQLNVSFTKFKIIIKSMDFPPIKSIRIYVATKVYKYCSTTHLHTHKKGALMWQPHALNPDTLHYYNAVYIRLKP